MGLITRLAFLVILFYGTQLRSVDSKPNHDRRYCGSELTSELERRCALKGGFNSPKKQESPYLWNQEKRIEPISTERTKEINIVYECCHSTCTEEFLDSFCLSSNKDEDTVVESDTVETTTITGRKRRPTKKPKNPLRSGKKQKGISDINSEQSASNTEWPSQTETTKDKNGRGDKKKDKCNKKSRDKNNKPCRRKSRKDSRRKNRKKNKNKKNKPTRRPKRWDSETTTLSDFLFSRQFLQRAYDSDIDVDEITTEFGVIPEEDISSSISEEELNSNQVKSDDQRTEQFIPADTRGRSFNNNMNRYNSKKETSSESEANPAAIKLKELANRFSRIRHIQDATNAPQE